MNASTHSKTHNNTHSCYDSCLGVARYPLRHPALIVCPPHCATLPLMVLSADLKRPAAGYKSQAPCCRRPQQAAVTDGASARSLKQQRTSVSARRRRAGAQGRLQYGLRSWGDYSGERGEPGRTGGRLRASAKTHGSCISSKRVHRRPMEMGGTDSLAKEKPNEITPHCCSQARSNVAVKLL